MSVTNHAIGESINLAQVLNQKLEAPIKQSEMGLDAQATATGDAVRYDEFTVAHNNDGSLKAIKQASMGLDTTATATGKAVRWDEFSNKHNNDGSFKSGIIANADISATAAISATKLAIRQNYNKTQSSNPSATTNTYGTAVTLTPATGFGGIFPEGADIVFGGTFGSETVTAQITVTYDDTTTYSYTKTATAIGTYSLINSDLMQIIKDGHYITQISCNSKSTIASSTATVTFNRYGVYI